MVSSSYEVKGQMVWGQIMNITRELPTGCSMNLIWIVYFMFTGSECQLAFTFDLNLLIFMSIRPHIIQITPNYVIRNNK